MPDLFDMPPKQKFNFPGLVCRSLPTINEVVPQSQPAVETPSKPKATRKPKVEKEVAPTGGKKLVLGKPKF